MDGAWNAGTGDVFNDSELQGFESAVLASRRCAGSSYRGSRKVARKDRRISKPKGSWGMYAIHQNFKRWPSEPLCGERCVVRGTGRKAQQEASGGGAAWSREATREDYACSRRPSAR